MENKTEAAIAIALHDTIVREQIPVATGEYEIVEVGPVQYDQTGPGDEFSCTFTAVTFRCCNKSSLYRVIVDAANETIINRDWQWVKEPMPCGETESPKEYFTLEDASAALTPVCALAVPASIPDGYSLSLVRVYGEPCPRREIIYLAGEDTLRLVQTCNGSPAYAFATTGKVTDEVTVRGARAEFIKGIDEDQVSWTDNDGSYWLSGRLEKTELLMVASSVQPCIPEASQVREIAQRHSLNVLRGEPYTINGSIRNPGISMIQVWVLDGEISTHFIPVMQDGSFQFTLGPEETGALPRDFSVAIVVHSPRPPDNFTITWNESTRRAVVTGDEISASIVSHLEDRTLYPTTRADYLEQAIFKSGQGNSAETYFLNGVDGWITIDPVGSAQPGTLKVRGSTSLPAGTPLSISVMTALIHPTPKNYDWSHEMAGGSTRVVPGTGGIHRFSCDIDTSDLYPGNYLIGVESRDNSLQADATGTVELRGPAYGQQEQGTFIDWSRLDLPPFLVNEEVKPEMLDGAFRIVPPGIQARNNEIPYGSIIDLNSENVYTTPQHELLPRTNWAYQSD